MEPRFIGFEDTHVADLLLAARAAILPAAQPHEPPPKRDCEKNAELDQINSQLALIADTLRSSTDFDRIALAAALDVLREMLAAAGRSR